MVWAESNFRFRCYRNPKRCGDEESDHCYLFGVVNQAGQYRKADFVLRRAATDRAGAIMVEACG